MAATIAHFAPRVEALAARLPPLLDAAERARVDAAVADYVGEGRAASRSRRAWSTLDTLYSTLDIVEVADATKRPVELVAEIYFELSTRLGLAWLREMIARAARRRALADARAKARCTTTCPACSGRSPAKC